MDLKTKEAIEGRRGGVGPSAADSGAGEGGSLSGASGGTEGLDLFALLELFSRLTWAGGAPKNLVA